MHITCFGQELEVQQNVAKDWVERLQEDEGLFNVPDESIVRRKAIKARSHLLRLVEKALDKSTKKADESRTKTLFMTNANASLWSGYIQGDYFSRFMKHLVTATQISQGHIHKVRDAYHKWIIHPSNSNLMNYSEILWQTGRSYEILCELKIVEQPGDGSYVLYHSISDQRVRRLENSGMKHIPVGNYYLWREMDGIPRSEMSNATFCVTKEHQVSIETKLSKID